MANCTVTGTVFWNTLPKAGVTCYARIVKTGEVQYTEAQRVAVSDALGLVTFDLPQSCIAYIEGEFQCGTTNFNVQGGVALVIPAAASATLETLSAGVIFPQTGATVQDDGVALANPISTFNFGTGLTAVESSPGVVDVDAAAAGSSTFLALTDTPATFVGQSLKVARVNAGETALEFATISVSVTAEEIQDGLVSFFPDIAPFDWTYDDAGDRVTLNILDATSGARGLMSTAYAARLDQLEVGDSPTFAGMDLTGNLRLQSDAGQIQLGASSNVVLNWDAADILALRRSTNAQIFRVYNTFTNTSNYTRSYFGYVGSTFKLQTESAGTGTATNMFIGPAGPATLYLLTDNTARWRIEVTTGHFVAHADNAYDIGTSGANRPRAGYFGTSVRAPLHETAASVGWRSGAGAPEGVVAAAVGSLYTRTDGGAGTVLYVKETGAATSAGWVAK